MPFINAVAKIKLSGPARIQGPEEIVLTGGSAGFWVESNGVFGEISIEISCAGFEEKIRISVE